MELLLTHLSTYMSESSCVSAHTHTHPHTHAHTHTTPQSRGGVHGAAGGSPGSALGSAADARAMGHQPRPSPPHGRVVVHVRDLSPFHAHTHTHTAEHAARLYAALPPHAGLSAPIAGFFHSPALTRDGSGAPSLATVAWEVTDADLTRVCSQALTPAAMLRIAMQLCDLLACLESAGIVLCALPPCHVLVSPSGHVHTHALCAAVCTVGDVDSRTHGLCAHATEVAHALERMSDALRVGVHDTFSDTQAHTHVHTQLAPEVSHAVRAPEMGVPLSHITTRFHTTGAVVDLRGQMPYLLGCLLMYVLTHTHSHTHADGRRAGWVADEDALVKELHAIADALIRDAPGDRNSLAEASSALHRVSAGVPLPPPPLPSPWRMAALMVHTGMEPPLTYSYVMLPVWPHDSVAALTRRAALVGLQRTPGALLPYVNNDADGFALSVPLHAATHNASARVAVLSPSISVLDCGHSLWQPPASGAEDAPMSSWLPRVVADARIASAYGITAPDAVVNVRSAAEFVALVSRRPSFLHDDSVLVSTPLSLAPSFASSLSLSASASPPQNAISLQSPAHASLAAHMQTPPRFTPSPGAHGAMYAPGTPQALLRLVETDGPSSSARNSTAAPSGLDRRDSIGTRGSTGAMYVTPLRPLASLPARPVPKSISPDDARFVQECATRLRPFGVRCSASEEGHLDIDLPCPITLNADDALPPAFAAVARSPPRTSPLRDLLRDVQNRTHTRDEARLAVLSGLGLPEIVMAALFIATYVVKDEMAGALALQSLSNLAMVSDTRARLAGLGAIDATVAAMEQLATSSRVAKDGIVALRHLAYENDSNKQRIVDCGGVHAVVRAMARTDDATSQVQRQACGALAIFAVQSTLGDSAKRSILDAGGVPAILRILRTSRHDTPLLAAALKALSMLAGLPEARHAAREAGALDLLDSLSGDSSLSGARDVQDALRFAVRKLR